MNKKYILFVSVISFKINAAYDIPVVSSDECLRPAPANDFGSAQDKPVGPNQSVSKTSEFIGNPTYDSGNKYAFINYNNHHYPTRDDQTLTPYTPQYAHRYLFSSSSKYIDVSSDEVQYVYFTTKNPQISTQYFYGGMDGSKWINYNISIISFAGPYFVFKADSSFANLADFLKGFGTSWSGDGTSAYLYCDSNANLDQAQTLSQWIAAINLGNNKLYIGWSFGSKCTQSIWPPIQNYVDMTLSSFNPVLLSYAKKDGVFYTTKDTTPKTYPSADTNFTVLESALTAVLSDGSRTTLKPLLSSYFGGVYDVKKSNTPTTSQSSLTSVTDKIALLTAGQSLVAAFNAAKTRAGSSMTISPALSNYLNGISSYTLTDNTILAKTSKLQVTDIVKAIKNELQSNTDAQAKKTLFVNACVTEMTAAEVLRKVSQSFTSQSDTKNTETDPRSALLYSFNSLTAGTTSTTLSLSLQSLLQSILSDIDFSGIVAQSIWGRRDRSAIPSYSCESYPYDALISNLCNIFGTSTTSDLQKTLVDSLSKLIADNISSDVNQAIIDALPTEVSSSLSDPYQLRDSIAKFLRSAIGDDFITSLLGNSGFKNILIQNLTTKSSTAFKAALLNELKRRIGLPDDTTDAFVKAVLSLNRETSINGLLDQVNKEANGSGTATLLPDAIAQLIERSDKIRSEFVKLLSSDFLRAQFDPKVNLFFQNYRQSSFKDTFVANIAQGIGGDNALNKAIENLAKSLIETHQLISSLDNYPSFKSSVEGCVQSSFALQDMTVKTFVEYTARKILDLPFIQSNINDKFDSFSSNDGEIFLKTISDQLSASADGSLGKILSKYMDFTNNFPLSSTDFASKIAQRNNVSHLLDALDRQESESISLKEKIKTIIAQSIKTDQKDKFKQAFLRIKIIETAKAIGPLFKKKTKMASDSSKDSSNIYDAVVRGLATAKLNTALIASDFDFVDETKQALIKFNSDGLFDFVFSHEIIDLILNDSKFSSLTDARKNFTLSCLVFELERLSFSQKIGRLLNYDSSKDSLSYAVGSNLLQTTGSNTCVTDVANIILRQKLSDLRSVVKDAIRQILVMELKSNTSISNTMEEVLDDIAQDIKFAT